MQLSFYGLCFGAITRLDLELELCSNVIKTFPVFSFFPCSYSVSYIFSFTHYPELPRNPCLPLQP